MNDEGIKQRVAAKAVIESEGGILALHPSAIDTNRNWHIPGGIRDTLSEPLQQTAVREVMEETGWEIDDLVLFRINDNPGRPKEDRQNIDFIFIAKAINRTGSHDDEVREVKWFPLGDLPPMDQIAFDHGEDLEMYLKHLKIPMTLPILG